MRFNEGTREFTVANEPELRRAETIIDIGFGSEPRQVQLGITVDEYPITLSGLKSALTLNGLRVMEPDTIPSLILATEKDVLSAWESANNTLDELILDPA